MFVGRRLVSCTIATISWKSISFAGGAGCFQATDAQNKPPAAGAKNDHTRENGAPS